MFCANCGSSIDKSNRFCPSCGTKIPENSNQVYNNLPAPSGNPTNINRMRANKKILYLGACMIVVLIVIIMINSSARSEFSIQGIALGDSTDKIEKQLGIAQEKFSGRSYTYDGIEFSAEEGKIDRIRVWSADYRTDKEAGVRSTLAQLVDAYGKDNLKMSYANIYLHLEKNQVIAFQMNAYDSTELYDTTIVGSMEISDLGDRFQEKWDSLRSLEYQIE